MEETFPILEFDPDQDAIINPNDEVDPIDISEKCVICFFKEVLEKIIKKHKAKIVSERNWEDGPSLVYELDYRGNRIAFLHPGIGAPKAAGQLEQAIALGCRKFIVCGGCGVLKKNTIVGDLIIPISAVRDEGTSYHYLSPSREVEANPDAIRAIEKVISSHNISYKKGKTWTTDAAYRETRKRMETRVKEGCLTVEMEAAAFFAVAQFRKVTLGQILYGGDDLSGEKWDNRIWQDRTSVREKLFWLAVEAVMEL